MHDGTAAPGGQPVQLALWTAEPTACKQCLGPLPPHVPHGRRREFCSRRCNNRYHNGLRPKTALSTEPITCRQCGEAFRRPSKHGARPRYCSQPCKDRAGHPGHYKTEAQPRPCVGCGEPFPPTYTRGEAQLFCSIRCGRRTRIAQGEPTRLEPRACEECGAIFEPIMGFYQGHGSRRTCSPRCAARAAAGRRAIREATGICEYCQSPFVRPTTGTRSVKYCSAECGEKHRYPVFVPKYADRFEPRACVECGKTFTTGKRGPLADYCSQLCRMVNGLLLRKARKRAVTVEVFSRRAVFERDGWECGLCGRTVDERLRWPHPSSPSLDHVIPLAKGGPHTRDNTQLAHLYCNLRKGDMLPAELQQGRL